MKPVNGSYTESMLLPETASQTAGPYVHIGLALAVAGLPERNEEVWNRLADERAEGSHILVTGRVFDGNGDLLRDALLEAWQADHNGEYQPDYDLGLPFRSFGRTATRAEDGIWDLHTIKPGTLATPSGKPMAPHINLSVLARGINVHLQTRLYFGDEAEANAACPILSGIESEARRNTLVAERRTEDANGRPHYHLDIRLQGDGETVFFDF